MYDEQGQREERLEAMITSIALKLTSKAIGLPNHFYHGHQPRLRLGDRLAFIASS